MAPSGLLALLALTAMAACSRMAVEGDCVYKREVLTTYQCAPDGKIEHWRLEPSSIE